MADNSSLNSAKQKFLTSHKANIDTAISGTDSLGLKKELKDIWVRDSLNVMGGPKPAPQPKAWWKFWNKKEASFTKVSNKALQNARWMVKHLRKKDPALATMLEKQVAVDLKVGKYATDAPLTKKGTAFSLLGFKKGAEAAEKPKKGNQQQKLVGLNVKAISDSTKVLPDSIKTHTAYLDSLQKANTEGAQQDLEQHGGWAARIRRTLGI